MLGGGAFVLCTVVFVATMLIQVSKAAYVNPVVYLRDE